MKVGDYVRIKNEAGWCCIGEIYNINEFRESDMRYCIDIQGIDVVFVSEDMIVKSSPNILDVIETGDIISGKDNHKFEVYAVGSDCVYINELKEFILTEEIKSVLTKEQFEKANYVITEN